MDAPIAELHRGPQCVNKKPFSCRMAAESALAIVLSKDKHVKSAHFNGEGRVYQCECCAGWHITSKKKMVK